MDKEIRDLIIVVVALVLLIGLGYGGRISGGVVAETLIAPMCEKEYIINLVSELRDMNVRMIDCAKLIGRYGSGGNIRNLRVMFVERCRDRNAAIGICKNALKGLKVQ